MFFEEEKKVWHTAAIKKGVSMNIPYKKLFFLTLGAFILRGVVFFLYVQHEQRYCQPDTPDYHISGINLCLGKGMVRYGTPFPFFWRAPGYPWYLSHFFRSHGVTNLGLEANAATHKSALWVQIALASCVPAILFVLALMLTGSLFIAWFTAGITMVHPGFVLASTFLLTEGISLIFFFLFLLFFYQSFRALGDGEPTSGESSSGGSPNGESISNKPSSNKSTNKKSATNKPIFSKPIIGHTQTSSRYWLWSAIAAGLFLALATWLRPMGEYVAIVASVIILAFATSSLRKKLLLILIILSTFFAALSPWYVRNYTLTHKIFFCPMMGAYLNAFIAPRVLRDVQNRPLDDTFRELQLKAGIEIQKDYFASLGTGLSVIPEEIPLRVALPIIKAHPWYAAYEWMQEVMKSTFDLYSWQLVALVKNCFKSDPLEEFLGEKTAQCLYKDSLPGAPLPLTVRIIAWLEAFYALLLWIGILFGFWYFLLRTAFHNYAVPERLKSIGGLWLKTGFMIGSLLFMTGGFGYARLRLPVEPLLIILALTAWLEIVKLYQQRKEVA
jgi:uncharacterized membrane protein (UPF0136 family)